jgi:Protein of unknown function (DUF2783)
MNQPAPCGVMTDDQRDAVYTQLCQTLTEVGELQAPLMLARLALLLMERLGDAELARHLIAAAAVDLQDQA